MSNRKQALVCFSYPPEFDRDSGSRRILDLMELLVAQDWKVSFLASSRMGEPRYVRALQERGILVLDGSNVRTEELLSAGRFDLALFAMWNVAEVYLPVIRRVSPETRVVVDSVDLNFLRNARRCFRAQAPSRSGASLDDRYGAELVRELNVYAAADAVLTVSQKEADLLNDFVGEAGLAQVVPDLEDRPASSVPAPQRRGILFMGSFRHLPNVGAVEFLCRQVVPRLNPALTAVHPVYIIGEGLDDTVRRFGEHLPQVHMVGWVPTVEPYLETARVSVIPLQYGAGTKRKLLQTLMAATPAVSTSIGAEGFGLISGKHLLVADAAEQFATAVTQLLQDDSLWQRLARQGRAQVLKLHQRKAVLASFCAVIERVMAAQPKQTEEGPGATAKKPARLDQQQYEKLRGEIQKLAVTTLPADANVIVVSRGDEELLKLDGRHAWHFPQTTDGVYAGCYPADSAEAIRQLQALRLAKGANYVLFPQTAVWWLDHYAEFRQHLEANSVEVIRQEGLCVLYHLASGAGEAKARAATTVETAARSDVERAAHFPAPRARLIAFYLPQFHPIPENDQWWGEGFTEWINVGKSQPLFPGHYQPHIPADLGFYDLRLAETRQAQAELARQYGIHGFCYYHYWFKGKRLLERPFNEVLLSRQPDFPFCLCWANEPWSRRWNGRPEDVLQAQEYSPEDDLAHIRWLLPALADPRAIRIEGKPVFLVYQGQDLPDPARTVEAWRREVARAGLPGLFLIAVETGRDARWDATQVGFDAKVLFQPQFTTLLTSGAGIAVPGKRSLQVFDYQKTWPVLAKAAPPAYRHYETVCPGWDNSPRRGDEAVVLHNSTPAAYEQWLRQAVAKAALRPTEHRLVFINAWNEWGEGCHLEPDVRSGHAYLEATRRALWTPELAVQAPKTRAPVPAIHAPPSTPPKPGNGATGANAAEPSPAARPAQDSKVPDSSYLSLLAAARGERTDDYVPLSERNLATTALPVKTIAFYLPQYHAIPENDEWWGRGFTEWTNVSKAVPQFVGHYQPHLPGELGFYDLRVPEVQRRQVELARQYGLQGFCFYYYWFHGKRLLERPLNQFMTDPEIDFPFCVCWANENWTRRWDGKDSEILIAQEHGQAADLSFIRDLEPILRHKNYLRVNGRPLLMVYRVRLLPDPAATAQRWRDYCRQAGLENPYLVAAQVFENIDPRAIGFDAAVEFPPNTPGPRTDLTHQFQHLNPGFSGTIYSYADLIKLTVDRERPDYQLFKTVCPSWDNDPRRPGRGATYALSSPKEYTRWFEGACRFALAEPDPDKRLVFINAWNEWGEGTHLEPDRRYGYAYLQATANVLTGLPQPSIRSDREWTVLFVTHDAHPGGAQLVLLNQIAWMKQHTSIRLKILSLERGAWLSRFRELGDVAVLRELRETPVGRSEEGLLGLLRDFCGGIPDLIYGNSVASGQAFALLTRLGAPILTHFHELESSIQKYAKAWIGDVLKHSAHYVACCDPVRDNLVARHGVNPNTISTVSASIRPDPNCRPLKAEERAAVRKRLGLVQNQPLVFGCGMGMPFRKGADYFIKVALEVRKALGAGCHFYWIGDFHDGESDPKLGAWANHLAVLQTPEGQHITFLGRKENPREYLQAADLFLLPSREDPFPLVALEAAECGVPIVCFDQAGGMPAFVRQDAGAVVAFGDIEAMSQHVVELLRAPEHCRRLGRQAREKLLSNCVVDATAPNLFSVCRKIAGRKPGVSIIMPGYNHARFLPERLESIFSQSYRDFEVILLDDASTDASRGVLERYRGRADVRLVLNEANSGSTFKQWLKGIEMAQADVLWIAESDDACEPDFLASLLPAFQNPRVKLAYANSQVMDEQSKVVGDYTSCDYLTSLSKTKWANEYRVTAEQEINDGLGVKNTILSASAVLFRRFGLSPQQRATLERMRLAGDWYFFIHAIHGGEVFYTPRKLNYHRRHAESVIGKLLRQNRVGDFFKEFYGVQGEIFGQFVLHEDFTAKWEQYLRDQWRAFYPERVFEDLKEYYPLDQAREAIALSRKQGTAPLPSNLPLETRGGAGPEPAPVSRRAQSSDHGRLWREFSI